MPTHRRPQTILNDIEEINKRFRTKREKIQANEDLKHAAIQRDLNNLISEREVEIAPLVQELELARKAVKQERLEVAFPAGSDKASDRMLFHQSTLKYRDMSGEQRQRALNGADRTSATAIAKASFLENDFEALEMFVERYPDRQEQIQQLVDSDRPPTAQEQFAENMAIHNDGQ